MIAALLPMAFVTGLMGPYMSPIPINASMGMLISLAIAFTVTPWLALKLLGRTAAARLARATRSSSASSARLLGPFVAAPQAARNRTPAGYGIARADRRSRSALAGVKLVVLKMLPFDNKSEFQVVVDMPAGTPVEITAAVLHEMGAHLADRARGHRLPGLRRARRADQLQRPGAPVLPAQRLRDRATCR